MSSGIFTQKTHGASTCGRVMLGRRSANRLFSLTSDAAKKKRGGRKTRLVSLESIEWATGHLDAKYVPFTSAESELTMVNTDNRSDLLIEARFVAPLSILLQFLDQTFVLPVKRLELPSGQVNWKTAKASGEGEAMILTSIKGDSVPIDSATLRYLVDKEYAAKIDKSIADRHIPIAEAKEATKRTNSPVDPRWKDVCDDDLLE